MAFSSIVNLPDPYAPITTGIGTGLGGLLQGLAEGKIKQLKKQQLTEAGLPGVLADLDPQVQAAYLKQFGAAQQLAQQQQMQLMNDEYVDLISQGYSPSYALNQVNQANPNLPQINPQEAQESANIYEDISGKPTTVSRNELQKAESIYKPTPEQQLSSRIDNINKAIMDPNTPGPRKGALRRELDKLNENLDKRRNRLFDKTEKLREENTQDAIEARDMLDTVDRQLELVKSGQMTPAGTLRALENLGLDVDALKANDTQEFIKNNAPFLKNLRKLFGGQITEAQTKLYMRMIANEYQSPEGMRRILEGTKKAAKATLLRNEAMQKIMQANAGIPTETLKQDIENAISNDLKKLSQDFKQILKEEIPAAESGLGIAAKTAASKAIGTAAPIVGTAALGAGTGALLGSVFPGLGTGAGAMLGARLAGGAGGLREILRMLG